MPLPDTYFHLGGGAFGGPILKNRTFFWFATEGYGSNTTRNGSLTFPTTRERNGDFSQTFNSAGQLVVIYDPLTGNADGTGRTPFPGNIIPANRINAVGKQHREHLSQADARREQRQRELREHGRDQRPRHHVHRQGRPQVHRQGVARRASTSITRRNEPCANYWEPGLNGPTRYADPGDYLLKRRVNVLALNNTWLPSNNTVLTLRYGFTKFRRRRHAVDAVRPVDAGLQLDLHQPDAGRPDGKKFPNITATDYGARRRHRRDAPQLVLVERQRHDHASWPASTR